jgi:predicted MFS family arabinose efflux permease
MSTISLHKKISYIGGIGVLGIISTEFGVIGVLPQLAAYYNISIENAGFLLSGFALTIAVLGPFMVLFTSRFDKRKMMLGAIGLFLISNVLSAFAPPFWLLVLFRILPAFLHPVFFAMAIAGATDGAPKEMQLRLTSIIIGGIALSQVTIIPLSTFMASLYDWRISYVVQGIIILVAFLSIYFLLPPMPGGKSRSYGSQIRILTRPAFIAGTVFNFFLITAWFASYTYFADYLVKVKGLNDQQVSNMLLLFGITGVVSNFAAGRLLAKNLVGTTLLFLSGIFLLPILLQYTDNSFFRTALVVGFWGIMYGPCFLTGIIYMVSAAPDAKEFANSLQTSFGNLGVSAGTAISGWFIGTHTVSITPWIGLAFGVLALAAMLWRFYLDRKNTTETLPEVEMAAIH